MRDTKKFHTIRDQKRIGRDSSASLLINRSPSSMEAHECGRERLYNSDEHQKEHRLIYWKEAHHMRRDRQNPHDAPHGRRHDAAFFCLEIAYHCLQVDPHCSTSERSQQQQQQRDERFDMVRGSEGRWGDPRREAPHNLASTRKSRDLLYANFQGGRSKDVVIVHISILAREFFPVSAHILCFGAWSSA